MHGKSGAYIEFDESTSTPGNLREGLQQSWSHLTSTFQDVATREVQSDGGLLINQPTSNAGFYAAGTRDTSVTDAITPELEGSRSKALGVKMEENLDRGDYELWSWTAWMPMSAEFLHIPPDAFGFLEDTIFQVGIEAYVGVACPVVAPMVGRFFGKKGEKLDKFGANLGAISLPGQGHRVVHNLLQSVIQSMMKLGGISS